MYELNLYGSDTDPGAMREALHKLYAVLGILEVRREKCVAVTSKAEHAAAVESLRVIAQLLDTFGVVDRGANSGVTLSTVKRDLYMAENIERIVDSLPRDVRLIVWAHNGHIEVNRNWVAKGSPNMGALLRNRFGSDYYALGLTFGEGSFKSRQVDEGSRRPGLLQPFSVGSAPSGFVEWYLANARPGDYLIDFRSAPKCGPVAEWLSSTQKMRMIGAGFSNNWTPDRYGQDLQLREYFDGLMHVAHTTAAKTNPSGERKEGQSGALI